MNNGKICVSVCAETKDEMIADIKRAEALADIIELRFDCLKPTQFSPLHSGAMSCYSSKPVISTFRTLDQGGKRELSAAEREDFWNAGNESAYCDVEEDVVAWTWYWLWGDRICSYHALSGVPNDMPALFDRISNAGADKAGAGAPIIKIAAQVDDICEGIPVWKLLDQAKTAGKAMIPIAMGEAGKWTRILGLAHGAYLTYGSLERGKETADGQITARDMVEIYRVKELDENTKVFGVIGDPVSESLSPFIHNPAFVTAGINAVFLPLLVKDLDDFMQRMVKPRSREVELNFGGFSVTMPHKQAIIKHLDTIDPTAEKIGAVNTVKIEDGKLTGFNTDADGFITPLKQKFGDLNGLRVAVFGVGGVARACVYALKQENANVTVFARNLKKAKTLADEFGVQYLQLTTDHRPLTAEIDIVVDATPLGMKGPLENDSLFTADELKGVKFVYDLVTTSADTRIIREAKKAGIPAIGGLEMLVAQGAKQFEIWTGAVAPLEIMKASVLKRMKGDSK